MRTKGFTLIELVVVIAVLGALAGVLVPQFGSILGKADAASAATNNSSLLENLAVYQASYGIGYPDGYDLNTTATVINPAVSNGIVGEVKIEALTAVEVAQLNAAGIFTGYGTAGSGSATYTEGTATTLALNTPFLALTSAGAAQLGLQGSVDTNGLWTDTTGTLNYMVVGVGSLNTAVNKTIVGQAPVYAGPIQVAASVAPPNGLSQDDDLVYARFFSVFAIPSGSTPATNPLPAQLIGVLDSQGNGLATDVRTVSQ